MTPSSPFPDPSRVCFFYRLRAGAQEEYRARHREVWPQMVTLLQHAGVRHYSIFLRGRQLVSVLNADPDWPTALCRLNASEIQREWSDSLKHLFDRVQDSHGSLLYADEVFRLDGGRTCWSMPTGSAERPLPPRKGEN